LRIASKIAFLSSLPLQLYPSQQDALSSPKSLLRAESWQGPRSGAGTHGFQVSGYSVLGLDT